MLSRISSLQRPVLAKTVRYASKPAPKAPPVVPTEAPNLESLSIGAVQEVEAFKGNIIEENRYFSGQINETELRNFQRHPNLVKQLWPQPSFAVDKMADFITPDNKAKRAALKELLGTELFCPEYNVSIDRERDLAYERLKTMCENGHISVMKLLLKNTNCQHLKN